MTHLPNDSCTVRRSSSRFGPWMAVLGFLCLDVVPVPAGLIEPGTLTTPQGAPEGRFRTAHGSVRVRDIRPFLFSGEARYSDVDLEIPGRGPAFVWARTYRSRIGPNTPLGNGWDHSYNIYLEKRDNHLVLRDGNTRSDLYLLQRDGTWAAAEFFRQIVEKRNDEGYTLIFPHAGAWHFHPFDGRPEEGRISRSEDRNGNALTFTYDDQGNLTTVTDTLDRDIAIAYNSNGFIESVTDFAGRQLRYDYYRDGDDDGSAGDLKSVRSPIVENTPTGNDFSDGKTTVYTYTTGFRDDRLNHDLLTVTDPKGQTYLTNVYAHTIVGGDFRHTEDPQNLYFDRLVRQIFGDPGDIIDYVYIVQNPAPENSFATIKVVRNDRVGNVEERYYDTDNREVIRREFTGRATDRDAPTADNMNRPINPLRDDDPFFFETRWEWNDDALPLRIVLPNENERSFTYDDENVSPRARANLTQSCTLPGPLGGDQQRICEIFEYDQRFNFVARHVDGRGNEMLHVFDGGGNRTHTQHRIPSIVEDFEYNGFGQVTAHILPDNGSDHRRRDEYAYYGDGPQKGYLQTRVVDSGGTNLSTGYQYDDVGNITSVIDPRGHDTQFIVNELNQVVRRISREVIDGGGVRYYRDTYYDFNDNTVRIDVQNIDDAGVLQENTHFTQVFEYEILNRLIRDCREAGDFTGDIPGPPELPTCARLPEDDFITTDYQYDANRNLTLTRFGEATEGRQPENIVRALYDERDLLFQTIRAPGARDQSTDQIDYDGNGNVRRSRRGLEETPRESLQVYDGYDRAVGSVDPMGNTVKRDYDANHNLVAVRIGGELLDVEGAADNVRLSETVYVYDAMDRRIRTEIEHFDTETQQPILDGQSITKREYAANGRILTLTNDNQHDETFDYDSANRVQVRTDHKGNVTTYHYDKSSNCVSVLQVHKSDLGNSDERYTMTYTYDNLNRLISAADNINNTNRCAYDSRDNRTITTDALGHETRHAYDGVNRRVETVRDLNGNGADPDDPEDIVTALSFDDTSRRTASTDDNDHTTRYEYDALNRLTMRKQADNTRFAYAYDVHDNCHTATDPNGTVVTDSYDLLNRRTFRDVEPGEGVSDDTTFEEHRYDGLSRLVRGNDDDSRFAFAYDSLSNTTLQTLHGQETSALHDGVGNELRCTYPGRRIITRRYDELERVKTTDDAQTGLIVRYSYIGPRRVERCERGNGTHTEFAHDGINNESEDFGVLRIVRTTHTSINGRIIDDRAYRYDRMCNKTRRQDSREQGPRLIHDYAYDHIYRLTHTNVLDGGNQEIRDTVYELDGAGNRTTVAEIGDGHSGPPGIYFLDPSDPPADSQVNQYSATPTENREYDENGNLVRKSAQGDADGDGDIDIDDFTEFFDCLGGPGQEISRECRQFDCDHDGFVDMFDATCFQSVFTGEIVDEASRLPAVEMTYDFANRMVESHDTVADERHTYGYDILGRRVGKVVSQGRENEVATRFLYNGHHVIEEQDIKGATVATYISFVNASLRLDVRPQVMTRAGQDFYYHADDLGNTMAVTDGAGNVVERYEYADYGEVEFFDRQSQPIPESAIGNPYLFKGMRYDRETAFYRLDRSSMGAAYFDPTAGRYTSRLPSAADTEKEDPLVGFVFGMDQGALPPAAYANLEVVPGPLEFPNITIFLPQSAPVSPSSPWNAYTYRGENPWTRDNPIPKSPALRSDGDLVQVTSAISSFGGGDGDVETATDGFEPTKPHYSWGWYVAPLGELIQAIPMETSETDGTQDVRMFRLDLIQYSPYVGQQGTVLRGTMYDGFGDPLDSLSPFGSPASTGVIHASNARMEAMTMREFQ